jgi:hypothetical protein
MRLGYRVDAKGQLVGETAEARSAIADRAGQYGMLATHADWLCFLRTPPKGGPAVPQRVILAVDASGFPISDFIGFLAQSRSSGVLRLHAGNYERTVSFKDGEVRGATSDDPSDRLGEVMARLGYVTRAEIEAALVQSPPSKIGRILVDRGVIAAHDLWKCLTHQVSEIFHALVLCREGTLVLVNQELEERQGHAMSMPIQSLLMDSIRKIDEMAHFRKRIPHGRMYVLRKRAPDEGLEEEEILVLSHVDGAKTILELGQASKMAEFDVTRVVFRLMEGGYAQLSESAMVEPPASRPHIPPAGAGKDAAMVERGRPIIQVFNSIYKEIRNEVAKQGKEREFIQAANAAVSGEALSSSEVLAGLAFLSDGSLPEDALLAQFQKCREKLGADPAAFLKKALSDVMFFLLFQAGELLESRADEDLARRVKRLLQNLPPE